MFDRKASDGKDRLQKIIAERGYCSRRKAEQLISNGKVKVDGVLVTQLGSRFPADCKIEIEGKPLLTLSESKGRFVYFAVYKPVGFICTASDPQNRRLVTQLVPPKFGRVFPVGRLDINSEGLLFLTNDGDFANLVTHPSSSPDKTYEVTVDSRLTRDQIAELQKGIMLDDGLTAPCLAKEVSFSIYGATYDVTIHEGKNREVRRMMEHFNKNVKSLKRIRIGSISLGKLAKGSYVELPQAIVDRIKRDCELRKAQNSQSKTPE